MKTKSKFKTSLEFFYHYFAHNIYNLLKHLDCQQDQPRITAGMFSMFLKFSVFLFKGDKIKILNLSKPTRRSSAGSSRSSLSPDEENPKRIIRQFSLTEQNQRLTKDNLARIGNRQTKLVNHASKEVK